MNLRRNVATGLLFLCFGLIVFGCKQPRSKTRLNATGVHQITREFAEAARTSAPAGTVIRMKLQASAASPDLPDRLDVTLFAAGNSAERKKLTAKLLLSLGAVAQRHTLETGERRDSRDSYSVTYRTGLQTTHAIDIRFARQEVRQTQKGKTDGEGPRLAVILDDLGSDRAAAEAVFALPYPLTISVLPNHEHSREIADQALRRGFQVMLHLPMQSVANEAPEQDELRPGMTATQVQAMLEEMTDSLPNVVGVNNHQGSQATSDSALMKELMPALRQHSLFYIDSRTTAATVAFDAAKQAGVPAAFRNVPFLDDVQDTAAIRKQLALAVRGAKEKKTAIAIGHPHPATLEALREFLPTVRASGVQLVYASDLVQ